MKVEIFGKLYCESIRLENNDVVIYEGDLLDLLTSQQGSLELKLNYGTNTRHSVVLKQTTNGDVLFVPKLTECFELNYRYNVILISKEELAYMWNKMGYNLQNDMKYIQSASLNDYILTWAVTSNYRGDETSLEEYLNSLESECLAISSDRITVEQIFSLVSTANAVRIIPNDPKYEIINVYLDSVRDYEWNVLSILDDGKICFRLNNKLNVIFNP